MGPDARSPAISTHDLTCADATGSAYSIPRSGVPNTVKGANRPSRGRISSIAPEDLRAAAELGYRVKLLGVAVRTAKGIEQRVHPTMVPKTSSIAQVMGVTNAVTIDGEGIPPITLVGPGAGGAGTWKRESR